MANYYVTLQSKTHAFLLQNRFRAQGIISDLTYIPRAIMLDLCNMGIRFYESDLAAALNVIRGCGPLRIRVYREVVTPAGSQYQEINI